MPYYEWRRYSLESSFTSIPGGLQESLSSPEREPWLALAIQNGLVPLENFLLEGEGFWR